MDGENTARLQLKSVNYSVVVWNIETKQAICGSPAQVKSAGCTYTVAYANCNDYIFATGGK